MSQKYHVRQAETMLIALIRQIYLNTAQSKVIASQRGSCCSCGGKEGMNGMSVWSHGAFTVCTAPSHPSAVGARRNLLKLMYSLSRLFFSLIGVLVSIPSVKKNVEAHRTLKNTTLEYIFDVIIFLEFCLLIFNSLKNKFRRIWSLI